MRGPNAKAKSLSPGIGFSRKCLSSLLGLQALTPTPREPHRAVQSDEADHVASNVEVRGCLRLACSVTIPSSERRDNL